MNILSRTKISLLALLLLAATASRAALAQAGGGTQPPAQPAQSASNQSNDMNSSTTSNSASPMPNYADQSFLEDIFKSDQVEIQASQTAQKSAYSGDVKEYSRNMIQVHTQLTAQLTPLAKQLQISPKQKPSKKERKELAALDQLSGANFDTAYMQFMAKTQQHILKEFKSEASAQNLTMRKVVKADSPVLTQNYQVLQKIAESHDIPLKN